MSRKNNNTVITKQETNQQNPPLQCSPLLKHSTSKHDASNQSILNSYSIETNEDSEDPSPSPSSSDHWTIHNDDKSKTSTSKFPKYPSFIKPFADQSGSTASIKSGLTTVFSVGTLLGLLLPKDPNLPTQWYRIASSIMGYVYTLSWSIYFYPQVFLNHQQKATHGLSNDFSAINLLGYTCYTTYTLSFFSSTTIQEMYRQRHDGHNNTVQSNDVAFAIHAMILSFIWLLQIWWYGGFERKVSFVSAEKSSPPLSVPILSVIIIILVVGVFYACIIVAIHKNEMTKQGHGGKEIGNRTHDRIWNWLDYLYLLSFFKVIITIIKYIPQLMLNAKRKSTKGWSLWNVILDFIGGVLSLAQLFGDSLDMTGGYTGVTGNLAKLGLGAVTVFFNIMFFFQHYVLYPNAKIEEKEAKKVSI